MISFDDFKKVDLRVAVILQAERVENSDKLVRLQIDLGTEVGQRQIVAGIGLEYSPADLIGRQIIVVVNLEPKVLMGFESQGMLLAADDNGKPILLIPEKEAPNGCEIK
ncbi:MAG: methionine--tRNA ligase subunit beta [Candidatus Pacebacteria bacterium]|nr:methionine--tRNA ligase subunit beta [Candidatus Paceibacterota bacterium]